MLLWCCDLQKQLDVEPFGPNLVDVEKQIAAHNILHQAIQSYSTLLTPDSITSQVHVYNTRVIWYGSDYSDDNMLYVVDMLYLFLNIKAGPLYSEKL